MSTVHFHFAAPIPDTLTPAEVIHALHDHSNCMTLQPLTTGHHELPTTSPQTLKDTWWYPVDQHAVKTYEVTEGVIIIPGIGDWGKKYITFPACFQNFEYGIRTRADSSGVVIRSEYKVMPGSADLGEVGGEGEGVGYADWVLVEDVRLECGWWMMPFVKSSAMGAHKDICRKLIEKIARQKALGKLDIISQGEWEASQANGVWKGRDKPLPRDPPVEEEEGELRREAGGSPDKVTYG